MAAGTLMAAKSQKDQGDYAQKVGENNARYADASAADATRRGQIAENQSRNESRALMARQRTAMAANGIDFTTGTGALLLEDSAAMGAMDVETIRTNAMKQAFGLESQAMTQRSDGAMAKTAGNNNMFATLLTGGSRAYALKSGVKFKTD